MSPRRSSAPRVRPSATSTLPPWLRCDQAKAYFFYIIVSYRFIIVLQTWLFMTVFRFSKTLKLVPYCQFFLYLTSINNQFHAVYSRHLKIHCKVNKFDTLPDSHIPHSLLSKCTLLYTYISANNVPVMGNIKGKKGRKGKKKKLLRSEGMGDKVWRQRRLKHGCFT